MIVKDIKNGKRRHVRTHDDVSVSPTPLPPPISSPADLYYSRQTASTRRILARERMAL